MIGSGVVPRGGIWSGHRVRKYKTMITLIDTFNGRSLSRHRTLENAVLAQRKHDALVKKNNGPGSYLTYCFEADGEPVGWDEIEAVKMEIEVRR